MTLNTFSSSGISGVRITRDVIDELKQVVVQASTSGLKPGGGSYRGLRDFTVKVERGSNSMEFDSMEELDSVVADFPEWRYPDKISITSACSEGGSSAFGGFVYRRVNLNLSRTGKCNVFVGGDTNRWALTTGALVESLLRQNRGIHRFYRALVVLMLLATLAVTLPMLVGSLWFVVASLLGIAGVALLLAGMPLGKLLDTNVIELCK